MAYTVVSLWEGNSDSVGEQSTITRAYLVDVTGTDISSEPYVMSALSAQTPSSFSQYERYFYRSELTIETIITPTKWKCKVVWTTKQADKTPPPPTQDYTPEIAMSSGGGTTHITQSFVTVEKQPSSAIDYNMIGFDGKDVKGVDIMSPSIEFSETYIRDQSWLTYAIIRALTINSGKVLNEEFRGFPVGEVLYKGCDISRPADGSGKVKFTYHFAVSPNATDISIGNLTIADKKGWDYLWIRYGDEYNSTAKEVVKTPVATYVEKVYEWVSMAQLYLVDEDSWINPSGTPP
jgi:hypothetical protein